MDFVLDLFKLTAAAVVTAGVPVLLAWALPAISANVHQKDVALLADGAARAAGRIMVAVAEQMTRPGASLRTVIAAQAAAEVVNMKRQFPDTIKKLVVPDTTLSAMIQGEVGKLLLPSPAAPPVPANRNVGL